MKYGHFDDNKKEYVITQPTTPLPWMNYLGTEDFYGLISNTGGGYCFYKDARLRRLLRYRYNNIPLDSNGRYIYIKDGDEIWSPMWKPVKTELDSYECRHGLGYTIFKSKKNDLEAELKIFIPLNSFHEVWHLELRNLSGEIKKIRVWSFVEWCLWDAYDDMTNFQRNFSIGEVEVEGNAIFHKTEYRERRNHYAYFASTRDVSGYDTSRNEFVGIYNSLHEPQVIIDGKSRNSIAHGWFPIGSHQLDFEIAPNKKDSVTFLLGYEENQESEKFIEKGIINKSGFYEVYKSYQNDSEIENKFTKLKEYWKTILNGFHASTENDIINRMANIWNQYQCMVTFNMSRSASGYESGIGRGMGFRDSNQDVLGFVHIIPERARERILDIASTQLSDGACYHQYQPLTKKGNESVGSGFNDDPLWLVLSSSAYIKETGDLTILDEISGFADLEDSEATLLDHLEASLNYTINNKGPHGLPLIGHADWNDCLNLNCFSTTPGESFQLAGDIEGGIAESVMIAGLFCYACDELSGIFDLINVKEKSKLYKDYADNMRKTIEDAGWDGEWFLRAYDAESKKIGSKENEEGKIFIETQGWGILGGVGIDDGKAELALKSVEKYLATPNGIILQQPAYSEYDKTKGEITSYPPGYKENAGIFTHNNTWIQIAETIIGNGNKAFDYYMSVCPPTKEDQIDTYKNEPYVYCQMIAGRDAELPGESKNSWLSGTAAWSFVALSQYILGVQPHFNGLVINPCIPSAWNEFTIFRKFRGRKFNIKVTNPDNVEKGIKNIELNGEKLNNNLIPLNKMKDKNDIFVVMGK